jgi:hypothetical protein
MRSKTRRIDSHAHDRVSSLILVLLLCACSDSGIGPSGSSATPLPLVQGGQRATPTASRPPAATTLSVKFTSLAPVKADSYATATIKTAASAKCSITVEYKSGPATAAGLDPKTGQLHRRRDMALEGRCSHNTRQLARHRPLHPWSGSGRCHARPNGEVVRAVQLPPTRRSSRSPSPAARPRVAWHRCTPADGDSPLGRPSACCPPGCRRGGWRRSALARGWRDRGARHQARAVRGGPPGSRGGSCPRSRTGRSGPA